MEDVVMPSAIFGAIIIAAAGVIAGLAIGASFYAAAKRKFGAKAVTACIEAFKEDRKSECPSTAVFLATNPDGICSKKLEGVMWRVENIENQKYSDAKQRVILTRTVDS